MKRLVGSEAEMEALGREVGRRLPPGLTVTLDGPLGAGKTTLVRGIVGGTGGEAAAVTSPTFTILHTYPGPVYHIDAYRLDRPEEILDLDVEEIFYGTGLTLVEWPGQIAAYLPPERLEIRLAYAPGGREVSLAAAGERAAAVLEAMA